MGKPPSTKTKMGTINQGANDHHCRVRRIHIGKHAAETCRSFGTYLIAIGKNTAELARNGTVKYNDLIGEAKRSTGRRLPDWLFRSSTSQGGQTSGVGTSKGRMETDNGLLLSNPPTLLPPPELPPPWPPHWPSPNQSIYAKTMEE